MASGENFSAAAQQVALADELGATEGIARVMLGQRSGDPACAQLLETHDAVGVRQHHNLKQRADGEVGGQLIREQVAEQRSEDVVADVRDAYRVLERLAHAAREHGAEVGASHTKQRLRRAQPPAFHLEDRLAVAEEVRLRVEQSGEVLADGGRRDARRRQRLRRESPHARVGAVGNEQRGAVARH
eukprot:CAMPEP_0206164608 /NCGR_PEP_ID=MMETSP1474-20131121/17309_1 /ASSEMBLY_ACC=CAM_ASM_001110 /TAXON_ID=97495 /ORGANISM="Imantonia sp., Strain RCC918" /LENGTH=185 /DNA_ID=CAMNT_0053567581 /DNA_START=297 /DNA_END=850 /DNA_ORIENTATION=-